MLCSECKNKISDKAGICPHCGCPVIINPEKPREYSTVNGVEYDVTDIVELVLNEKTYNDSLYTIQLIRKLMDISLAANYSLLIEKTGHAPKVFDCEKQSDFNNRFRQQQASAPKCPHCQSINISKISGTERAVSVIGLGLLSKKINKSFKCKSCGYTW